MMKNERIERDVGREGNVKKGVCGRAGEKNETRVSFEA